MNHRLIIFSTLFAIVLACKPTQKLPQGAKDLSVIYQEAIEDAMSPGPGKVHSGLLAVHEDNQHLVDSIIRGEEYILVATWKGDTTFYKPNDEGYYNTGKYELWVTAVPELKSRMLKENATNVDLRLKQLLGLPPN